MVVRVYIEDRPLVFWDFMSHFTHRFTISWPMGDFWILIYYHPPLLTNAYTSTRCLLPGPSSPSSWPPTSWWRGESSMISLWSLQGDQWLAILFRKHNEIFLFTDGSFPAQCWLYHRRARPHQACGLHALQSQWPVHHGGEEDQVKVINHTNLPGPGLQLHVLPRRGGHDYTGPDT